MMGFPVVDAGAQSEQPGPSDRPILGTYSRSDQARKFHLRVIVLYAMSISFRYIWNHHHLSEARHFPLFLPLGDSLGFKVVHIVVF